MDKRGVDFAESQKGVLLVEGFRAHGTTAPTHVEAVGRLVSCLPQCLEVCSTSGREDMSGATSASPDGFSQVSSALYFFACAFRQTMTSVSWAPWTCINSWIALLRFQPDSLQQQRKLTIDQFESRCGQDLLSGSPSLCSS